MILFYSVVFKVSCWPHETLIKELRFSYAIFQVNIVIGLHKYNCQTIANLLPTGFLVGLLCERGGFCNS